MYFQRVSKSSNIFVLVLIGAIAVGLSIASYQYSVVTSEEIRKIGVQDLRSNAEIQAHDIARNLKNNKDRKGATVSFILPFET